MVSTASTNALPMNCPWRNKLSPSPRPRRGVHIVKVCPVDNIYLLCYTATCLSSIAGAGYSSPFPSHQGVHTRWFGRALAWHARGHRFDPGILHQSNAKRTQCHYSNGRQCVRFVLQTSTSCITHNKKARTFPLQSVRVFLCLYLVRGTKHRENFAKIFRLLAGAPAAMPYKKITG